MYSQNQTSHRSSTTWNEILSRLWVMSWTDFTKCLVCLCKHCFIARSRKLSHLRRMSHSWRICKLILTIQQSTRRNQEIWIWGTFSSFDARFTKEDDYGSCETTNINGWRWLGSERRKYPAQIYDRWSQKENRISGKATHLDPISEIRRSFCRSTSRVWRKDKTSRSTNPGVAAEPWREISHDERPPEAAELKG